MDKKNYFDDLNEIEKNIVKLLQEFENEEYRGRKGLLQRHFRYALMEQPVLSAKDSLDRFFNGNKVQRHNKLNN
ncbi:MAG: hypothetical protein V5A68_06940, partial [Candidatus Thermoplasmatota archaeon]